MRQILLIKKWLDTFFLLTVSIMSWANDFEVDGIYYHLNEDGKSVRVTYDVTHHNSYTNSVIIPSSVTHDGKDYSVTSIGIAAFHSCSGLTSITIPNSVRSIGTAAFSGCSGLTSIAIPNSVRSIGSAAFSGCSGLTSITIPNSVTSINEKAFHSCSGLTSITIPNSVTSIGTAAFARCASLKSITIPDSVTRVGAGVFYQCSGLMSVVIGSGVRSIGAAAFSGCSALKNITCTAADVPTTNESVFRNVSQSEATLYVPKSSVNKYKKTNQWKDFGKILPMSKR